jgi:hypothetical protein
MGFLLDEKLRVIVYFATQFLRLCNNSAWWMQLGTTGKRRDGEVLVLQLVSSTSRTS